MATPVIAQGVDSVPFKVACAVSKVTSREDCAAADAAPELEKNHKGVKMTTCPLSEDRYFHFRQLLQDRETLLTEMEVDQRSSAFVAGSFQRVAGDRKKRSFQIEKRDVHQPQYESLVEHISDRLDPDGGPIIVVELGAGKGLFGRLFSGGAADLVKSVGGVIDNLHTSKEEKLAAELKIKQLISDYEVEMEKNITSRWEADLKSDSWLSKNVRPMVLIFLIVCTMLLIFIDAGALNFEVKSSWVDLLQLVLITVIGAYFGGRSLEKVKK